MSKDFTRRMALKIFFQMDDIYEDIVRVGNNLDTLNIKREEIQDRNQPTQLIQSSPMQPIPMPVSTPTPTEQQNTVQLSLAKLLHEFCPLVR